VTNCCFSNSSCNSTNRAASSSVCSPHLMLMLARASHLLRRRRPRVNSKHITVPWTQTPFTQSRDALPCRVTIAAVASCRWVWRARTAGDAGDRSNTSRRRRRAFGIFPTRVARRERLSDLFQVYIPVAVDYLWTSGGDTHVDDVSGTPGRETIIFESRIFKIITIIIIITKN